MELNRTAFLEALGHEDFSVRSSLLEAFGRDRDPDPEVTRRAIAAIERWGWADAFEWPAKLTDLALDEFACDWLIRQVERMDEGKPDDRTKLHLLDWFSKGLLELVQTHFDRLKHNPVSIMDGIVFPHRRGLTWIDSVRYRLEFAGKSFGECEALLDEVLAQCAEQPEFPHEEVGQVRLLAERLKDAGVDWNRKVAEWLDGDLEDDSSLGPWRAGAAIILAGHRRQSAMAPRLIELLEQDWDWWNEEILRALVALGDRDTLCEVIAAYPGQEWHVRLFLSGVLEMLRFPDLERAIVALLESEEDDALRVELGVALVRYATPSAMEVARAVMEEEPFDPERLHIAEFLCAFHCLQGNEFPGMEVWQQRLEQMRQRERAMDDSWEPVVIPPLRKSTPDIGRNEPCPCGSGKKYKKCCLPKGGAGGESVPL